MKKILSYLAAFHLLIFLTACPPLPKGIKSFSASQMRAAPNERIDLTWTYEEGSTITRQILYLHRFSFYGIQKDSIILERSARTVNFNYAGAVSVQLVAFEEENDTRYSAILEVKSERPQFMNATLRSSSPALPYMGYKKNQSGALEETVNIDFTNYIAFYNNSGIANPQNPREIAIDDIVSAFEPGNSNIFRGITREQNNGTFTLLQGPMFPLNVAGNIDGGASNLIIYGGAIVYGYTETKNYKSDDGETIFYNNTDEPQPVFIAIPCMYFPIISQINITDIQLGNTLQGLITASALYNSVSLFGSGNTGVTSVQVNDFQSSAPTVSGEIKGAQAIFPRGTDVQSSIVVDIDAIRFNMDLVADNALFNYLSQPQNR